MADDLATTAPPPGSPSEPRHELETAPPFLTWTLLYLIVAALLLAELAAFAAITLSYR
jgi:hypothetical protein